MSLQDKKLPISVFIVCQDEEQHIERLLKSCSRFDEIILVDSGSTDKTLKIAEKFPVKIFHQDWLGYAKQKQFALEKCSHEWVLNLDADEELNDAIVEEFARFIQSGEADALRTKRDDLFMGKKMSRFSKRPNNLRLYRKSKAHFSSETLVHETAQVDGEEASTSLGFTHYGYNHLADVVNKNNQYSSLKAQEKFNKGKKFSYLKLLFIFPLIFIKMYYKGMCFLVCVDLF